MGKELVSRQFCHAINGSSGFKADGEFYRLFEDEETNALNGGDMSQCEVRKGRPN